MELYLNALFRIHTPTVNRLPSPRMHDMDFNQLHLRRPITHAFIIFFIEQTTGSTLYTIFKNVKLNVLLYITLSVLI